MTQIAVCDSDWLMVDDWEASQTTFVRTVSVLDHFEKQLAGKIVGKDGKAREVRIMLLAGGDLSMVS
jgi:nicotinamide mononucleotide adenylyltransferase